MGLKKFTTAAMSAATKIGSAAKDFADDVTKSDDDTAAQQWRRVSLKTLELVQSGVTEVEIKEFDWAAYLSDSEDPPSFVPPGN